MLHSRSSSWRIHALETGSFGSTAARCSARCRSRCGASSSRRTSATASGSRCAVCLLEGHGRRVLVDDGDRRQARAQARRTSTASTTSATRSNDRSPHSALDAGRRDRRGAHAPPLRPRRRLDASRRRAARAARSRTRATYVQRRNWDNALAPNPRERASYMPENFVPLEGGGRSSSRGTGRRRRGPASRCSPPTGTRAASSWCASRAASAGALLRRRSDPDRRRTSASRSSWATTSRRSRRWPRSGRCSSAPTAERAWICSSTIPAVALAPAGRRQATTSAWGETGAGRDTARRAGAPYPELAR